jgi:hypothetical protein
MCADASIDSFDIPYDTIFGLDCSIYLAAHSSLRSTRLIEETVHATHAQGV